MSTGMFARVIAGGIVAAALVACGGKSGTTTSDTKNVFGRDDREAMTSSDAPWAGIGKLSTGCTGTLIGRRLVLTAAHCLFSNGQWMASDFHFYPNYKNGASNHSARVENVWYGSMYPDTYRHLDWAILLLDTNLGDVYGWSAVQSYNFSVGDYLTVAGYSGDFALGLTAGVHRDCRVQGGIAGLIFHDCDMTRGASGGPTFGYFNGEFRIVGVNVAELRDGGESSLNVGWYSHNYANISVPASTFIADVLRITREYR